MLALVKIKGIQILYLKHKIKLREKNLAKKY